MNRLKKILEISSLLVIVFFSLTNTVFAGELSEYLTTIEYSEEYKNWLNLSEDERANVLMPSTFTIPKTTASVSNPLYNLSMLGATYATKYDLRDYISENVVVRAQGSTNTCWAFAFLGSLESTLGLRDYRNSVSNVITYDYSERHMAYATSKTFLNDVINEDGFDKDVSDGGNIYMALAYATNGQGAVLEEDMPFEDNEDTIDISEIQNKTVQTQVYDTIDFAYYYGTEDTEEIRTAMKSHIQNYGGIYAAVYGAQLFSDYYNNDTGAIYCDSSSLSANHAVTIIGWDDDYSIENFNEGHRPSENGAWIIKNSWGTEYVFTLDEMKEMVYSVYETECNNRGWYSASEIPDEFATYVFEASGYEIIDNEAHLSIGDNGIMYISYEDVLVYSGLYGIIDVDDEVSYDNIYQYNNYGIDFAFPFTTQTLYEATVFDRESSDSEYLTSISFYATEAYTCTVYVNASGSGKASTDLTQVELEEGSTASVNAGFHTLTFLNPIELTGDEFSIVLKLTSTRTDYITIGVEAVIDNSYFDMVTTETGKTFLTTASAFAKNEWTDLGKINSLSSGYPNADASIKAYTVNDLNETTLSSIEITTPPTKTEYVAGQDFDPTGMVVTANYSDGSSKEITDYTIENGEDLELGQLSVTITYQGISVKQQITVVSKEIESISINTKPTKTEYIQNEEELDLTGGKINATYDDGSTEIVSMTSSLVTTSGFDNSTLGTITITVTYLGKSTSFTVDIVEDTSQTSSDEAISAVFSSMKSTVTKVQAYYFTDSSVQQYIIMGINLSNITRSNSNDSTKYYYYLSSSQNKTNITDWVEITESQTSTTSLTFSINTKDISNFSEVSTSSNLYLYVKEVATKGTSTKTTTSPAVALVSYVTTETYIDGVKQSTTDSGSSTNTNTTTNSTTNSSTSTTNTSVSANVTSTQSTSYVNTSSTTDNTTATSSLPNTGKTFLFAAIAIIALFGIRIYVKYEKIDK